MDELERRIQHLNESLDEFEATHSPEEIIDFYAGMTREQLIRIVEDLALGHTFNEGNTGKATNKFL